MAERPAEATSEIGQYRDWVRQAAEICEQAARGNLEPRLLNLPAGGDLSRLTNGINGLLDIADAFVREAGACLDATAHHRFYRHIIVRGLLGSF